MPAETTGIRIPLVVTTICEGLAISILIDKQRKSRSKTPNMMSADSLSKLAPNGKIGDFREQWDTTHLRQGRFMSRRDPYWRPKCVMSHSLCEQASIPFGART